MKEDENWYQVSLRVVGDGVDPDAVTIVLGLEPRYTGRAGEHIRRNPKYALHETSLWTHSVTDDSSVSFEDQIAPLLDHLEARPAAAELFRQPDQEAELFLGFSTGRGLGSFAFFPPPLLSRLGALGLGIKLDLYPPSPSLALRRYEQARRVA